MNTVAEFLDKTARKQRPEIRLTSSVVLRAEEIFLAGAGEMARMAIGEAVNEFISAGKKWDEPRSLFQSRAERFASLAWNYDPSLKIRSADTSDEIKMSQPKTSDNASEST